MSDLSEAAGLVYAIGFFVSVAFWVGFLFGGPDQGNADRLEGRDVLLVIVAGILWPFHFVLLVVVVCEAWRESSKQRNERGSDERGTK